MKIQYSLMLLCLIIFSALMPVQANWRESQAKKDRLMYKANTAILNFERTDSELKNFFDRAYGWTMFPTVGKGAMGIGGAYGEGIVYEQKGASAMLS